MLAPNTNKSNKKDKEHFLINEGNMKVKIVIPEACSTMVQLINCETLFNLISVLK